MTEKLQQELETRRSYYFQGFGGMLQGLMMSLDTFKENATPENEKEVQDTLNKIIKYYETIPFEEITNHPDYDLFSQIKELIGRLSLEVEVVLINGGGSVEKSYALISAIGERGREYRERLTAIVRQLPGREKDIF